MGNVDWINDWKAGSTPEDAQLQDFTYDALNRLTHATVTGGTQGLYDEGYAYDATTGNLATKAGVSYEYGDPAHEHAVTAAGSNEYDYDDNGNMEERLVDGDTFDLGYDAENRLISVSGAITASFVYDGDGNRVKSTIGGTTTYFVGNLYEKTGGVATKYYYAGSQRIAVRVGSGDPYYLLSDHLGSTTVTTDSGGNLVSELRYSPWGETRYTSGTTPTDYTYTAQYSNVNDFGLMFYNARWYDPSLGRFAQADSIVGYDRYAYVNNNPVSYTDPTGHFGKHRDDKSDYWNRRNQEKVKNLEKQWEREKAEKRFKELVQATWKEFALDPSLGVAGAFGGGRRLFGPIIPPSPYACEWVDCGLSAFSVIASGVTLVPIPGVQGAAIALDIGATLWAAVRTAFGYLEGDITPVRAAALEITGLAGLTPGEFGIAFSVINAWFTFSGRPN